MKTSEFQYFTVKICLPFLQGQDNQILSSNLDVINLTISVPVEHRITKSI